jgi:hypothetical protein
MRFLISLSLLLGGYLLLQFLGNNNQTGMLNAMLSVDLVSLAPSSLTGSSSSKQRFTLSSVQPTIEESSKIVEGARVNTTISNRKLPNPLLAKEPLFLLDYADHQNNPEQYKVLIIGILSARENFDRRQTIRQLWKDEISAHQGVFDKTIPIRAIPIFLVGASYCHIPLSLRTYWFQCPSKNEEESSNKKLYDEWTIEQEKVSQRLIQEDMQHRDLLILNVSDYYHNSPFKVATFLAWAASQNSNSTTYVPNNVHWIMKMDDDVYLDWRRLAPRLYNKTTTTESTGVSPQSSSSSTWWWWGYLRTNEIVHRNISDRFTARWSISSTTWLPNTWPPFMSGGGNILHRTAAEYIAQNYDRFLHHDLFGEDIALGVWFSGTNIQYWHDDDDDEALFPKNPRLANCTTNVILFVGQPALFNKCEAEVHRRIAFYAPHPPTNISARG